MTERSYKAVSDMTIVERRKEQDEFTEWLQDVISSELKPPVVGFGEGVGLSIVKGFLDGALFICAFALSFSAI